MPALVAGIHVLLTAINEERRGCPAQGPGMTRRVLPHCLNEAEGPLPQRRSGPVPGLEGANLPFALRDATGFALHPGFIAVAHVARQEVPAGRAILIVGGSDRRDRAARASARVFPWRAAVGAAASEEFADCCARDG